MTPGLQAFAEKDAGFQQFNERYDAVSADPETRRKYAMWFNEALRQEGMLAWARQEGREEVEPRLAEAEQKLSDAVQKLSDAARSMKNQGVPIDTIKIAFPSLADEIETM